MLIFNVYIYKMSNYDYIVNPATNKKISLHTQQGINILEQYTNKLDGGGLASDLKRWFVRKRSRKKNLSVHEKIQQRFEIDREKERILIIMGKWFMKNIPGYSLQSNPHKSKIQNMYSYLSRTRGVLDSHDGLVDNRISLEELRSIASSYNISLERQVHKPSGVMIDLLKKRETMKKAHDTTSRKRAKQFKDIREKGEKGTMSDYQTSRDKTIAYSPLEDRGIWKGD